MISEILSSSSPWFEDSKNGSLPSCPGHLSCQQKSGRGPVGGDTYADQDSSILQVLLFIEFNLVMHCTCDLYINQPFQHRSLKQWSRGDREEGWGESNDLRIKYYCLKPGEGGCCEQHGQSWAGADGEDWGWELWADDGLDGDFSVPLLVEAMQAQSLWFQTLFSINLPQSLFLCSFF